MYLKLIAGLYSGHFALNSEMEIAVAYFVSHTQQEKKKCKSTLADYPLLKASLGYDNIPRGLLNNVLNIEIAYFPG